MTTFNGIPVVIPNKTDDVDTGSPHWYVSYNNYSTRDYGCDTTALVLGQGEYFIILNGDHRVRSRRHGAQPALVVDVQPDARAPPEPVRGGVAGKRLDPRLGLDAGHALQRLGEHLALQLALVREGDVPELGPTGTTSGVLWSPW